MTKNEFLSELGSALAKLPKSERERTLDYYREIIEDRIENGTDEQEAVALSGSVSEIAASLMTEITPQPAKQRSAMLTALTVIGSPIWLSLMIALAAVLFALTAAVLAVAVAVFAAEVALGLSGLACALGAIPLMTTNPLTGVFSLGAACVLIGLAILLFKPLKTAATATYRFSIKAFAKALNRLFGKEWKII